MKQPDDILEAAGFAFLNLETDANSLNGMLAGLARGCEGLSNLERETVFQAALQKMKAATIPRATKMLDAAFNDVKREEGGGCADASLFGEDPEPWPEPVATADLLDETLGNFEKYSKLPPGGVVASALHCAFGHVHDAFEESPFLHFKSPTPECGKSRTMSVYSAMCYRPAPLSSTTTATLFRMIDKWHCTALLDEVDGLLKKRDPDLIALLNAGFNRHFAQVPRCVGDDHDVKFFSVWASKVMAAIGKLPETIVGQSITVSMKRKKPQEKLPRLRVSKLLKETHDLRRKFRRWAEDNFAILEAADPEIPDNLGDREAEAWRPLLAIADLAGGDWPGRAREAALILSGRSIADSDDSERIDLLIDLRLILEGQERMFSRDIVAELLAMEGRPWSEYRFGKPITQNQLSRLLSPFAVHSKQIRIGSAKYRGYAVAHFQEVFEKYIPAPPSKVVQVVQPVPGLRCTTCTT